MDPIVDDQNGHTYADRGVFTGAHAQTKPRGKPYSRQIEWKLIALVGASVAAGAAIGAAIALLAAPRSGEHTRLALAREMRRIKPSAPSAWDKLSAELRRAARSKRLRQRD